jgi:hypothetical protein
MDVNEWMSYECSDEDVGITFITLLLIHIHQKKKILANTIKYPTRRCLIN